VQVRVHDEVFRNARHARRGVRSRECVTVPRRHVGIRDDQVAVSAGFRGSSAGTGEERRAEECQLPLSRTSRARNDSNNIEETPKSRIENGICASFELEGTLRLDLAVDVAAQTLHVRCEHRAVGDTTQAAGPPPRPAHERRRPDHPGVIRPENGNRGNV